MTSEKRLISKNYYQTFMEGTENENPTKVLGELFHSEQQKVAADLSDLRFAQGEVYFLNKDYEAAIFKWENVNNELTPWALKNIADAHVALDFLEIAVEYYQAVKTDSVNLKTEVLLQLFLVYKQRGKLEMAANSIKHAVELNPDYPNVTDMARAFFEEQSDFSDAVELAVSEAVRTESISWFEVLESYIFQGHTAGMAPASFREALMTLYSLNQSRFESLLAALWRSYEQNELSLQWLKEINYLLLEINPRPSLTWKKLTKLYEETYRELMDGTILIEELSSYIPNHLTNWMKISTGQDAVIASSAVLTWNELYPVLMDETIVTDAEQLVSHSSFDRIEHDEVLGLFDSIRKWASKNGLILNEQEEWLIDELLDSNHFHLMVTGTEAVGKSELINKLLGREIANESTLATIQYKYADQMEIQAITDREVRSVADLIELDQMAEEQVLINCNMPIPFLRNHMLTLIDTPTINRKAYRSSLFAQLNLADGLLFVMDASSPLTSREMELAITIREQAPELPIHFILSDMQQNANDEAASDLLEKTTSWIQTYFQSSRVFTYRPISMHNSQAEEIEKFIQSMVQHYNPENEMPHKILHFSKQLIKLLLVKRVEMENTLLETIKWNEDMAMKLDGAVHQLRDLHEEKVQVIKENYRTIIDKMRQDLLANIPSLLVSCAKLVKEDSDFDNIHVTLNDEMNKQINDYIDDVALPKLITAIQGWLATSEVEFNDSEVALDEMAESLNQLHSEEQIRLDCDFKVLDDWHRDVDRMTSGSIQLEKINIIKSSPASQFIMKNADKLFGAIIKNKGMLQNKYKQFIQTKDYSKTAESITNTFMQQFEYFEKTLERDINMFFANPYAVLNKAEEDKQHEISANEQSLNKMQENPEIYTDPLKLFELKTRQYEWMSKEVQEYDYR
ncbi:GTPase domain-containing protein [Oceanobacillus chungangensis]|uniref:GTP-binding protein n=1 Tax=Oceanobacillus chungangensis TaxID=1229152 RepID=A0A3D8PJJ5_9BACI|nr:GTPase [Oceanobacillus chungangensis]RDW15398.1 GTP-binding protein [Oceanobacillus chungangensis]